MRIKAFTFFVCLFALSTLTNAQYNSIQERFSVDYIMGCEGLTINITHNLADTVVAKGIAFWYEGYTGGQGDESYSHTYTSSGQYYAVMLVNEILDEFEGNQLDSILINVIVPQPPEFTIHNCDNHRVKVEITGDYYDSYSVKFSTTDSVTTAPLSFSETHDYSVQDQYVVDVKGILNDAPFESCPSQVELITTIDNIITPAITSIETISNNSNGALQLAHDLGDNIIYNLSQSDNSSDLFVDLNQINGAQTPVDQLNTKNNYYCYQINTYDACNDVVIPSNIVCSVNFRVEASDDGNNLIWNTDETQATSYEITRNDALLIEITDLTIKSFNDTAVICKQEYEYLVSADFPNTPDPATGTSPDTIIIASQSGNLPAIETYPYSTVTNEQVNIQWSPPSTGDIPFRRYIVERNVNDRTWSQYGTSDDTTFIDTESIFRNEYSYRILYDDDCGNKATPSPLTTPVVLQQLTARGKVATYEWNKYDTWTEGIRNYTLERLDSAGNIIEEFSVLSGRTKEVEYGSGDLDHKYIRVRAESLDATPIFTYSNIVETRLKLEMFLPSAFTPDGDDLNDYLIAKGPAVYNFYMEVYNRWGIRIFSTNDIVNGWDGKVNGEKSPEGTYVYKINFEDGSGEKYNQSGSFVLLRHG
ncbi:MAG: gliding motility-associated C-terminal domain-containing protein [Reichenbachiella sp.]